jgi:hypothetical protein
MSFKITAESDLWESRGTFNLVATIHFTFQTALDRTQRPLDHEGRTIMVMRGVDF